MARVLMDDVIKKFGDNIVLTNITASSNYHAGFHLDDLFDSRFTNNSAIDNQEDGVFKIIIGENHV